MSMTVKDITTRPHPELDWCAVMNQVPGALREPGNQNVWRLSGDCRVTWDAKGLEIHTVSDQKLKDTLARIGQTASRMYDLDIRLDQALTFIHIIDVTIRDKDFATYRTVYFGSYILQGTRREPIPWLVLKEDSGNALLLSKFCLQTGSHMLESCQAGNSLWARSVLRQWLNRDFIQLAFSIPEQNVLLDTRVCGASDRVFLLSAGEVEAFFPTSEEKLAKPTPFAMDNGADTSIHGDCSWWILPKEDPEDPCSGFPQCVSIIGSVGYYQMDLQFDGFCLRPAIRVPVSALQEDKSTRFTGRHVPKETSRRFPLDDQHLNYLTVTFVDDVLERISIDHEAANDAHYTLDAKAAATLRKFLTNLTGEASLEKALRKYFATGSFVTLYDLMKQLNIPFSSHHYVDYSDLF